AMTNSIGEIQEADCILVMGSNTTGQHPMVASKILRARERGARLIVIDPRRVPIAENADLFLQIKPGTNIALLNAMIRTILEKGLADTAFIENRTEGFQELEVKVRERSLMEAEAITGIPVRLIEEAALTYARAEKAMIMYAMGVTQHVTGTDQVKAVANLAMLTGNIGKPSSGVNPLRGQNNVQGACDMGALPNVLTGYQQVSDPTVRTFFQERWGLQVPERPGLTVVEMIDAAAAGKIRGMLIVGENPMISDPDINHVREALDKLQFLVVQDIFLTETAQLADVVFPAVSFAEKDGTFTATDRRVQRVRKALEPFGDSKPDWQIVSELARRMGIGGFDYPSPREVMDEIRSLTPSYAGISYDRLDKGEVLHWPCPDEKHPGTPILHEREFARGRGKFFAVDYTPPPETPDEEFPYILTTGRLPFHFHGGSITRRIERLNEEVSEGRVHISPQDAKGAKIGDGETVEVCSRRGSITIRAMLSDEVEPGTVFIPMHFAEHAANVLTDARLDAEAKIPGFKVCSVKIKKLPQRKQRGQG
ncbi:MAG: formate dehydrogenase subunit alpha, partial [Thermodesulfobacteriota bacterium]